MLLESRHGLAHERIAHAPWALAHPNVARLWVREAEVALGKHDLEVEHWLTERGVR